MINISTKIEKNSNGNWEFIWEFNREIFEIEREKVRRIVGEDFDGLAEMLYEEIIAGRAK